MGEASFWIILMACTEPDPVRQAMEDPTWCPIEFDAQLSDSLVRMRCEAEACNGETDIDLCISEMDPVVFRYFPGFSCFDGCTMRQCLDGHALIADCMAQEEAADLLAACDFILKPEGECE
jgi:hypothetical protein